MRLYVIAPAMWKAMGREDAPPMMELALVGSTLIMSTDHEDIEVDLTRAALSDIVVRMTVLGSNEVSHGSASPALAAARSLAAVGALADAAAAARTATAPPLEEARVDLDSAGALVTFRGGSRRFGVPSHDPSIVAHLALGALTDIAPPAAGDAETLRVTIHDQAHEGREVGAFLARPVISREGDARRRRWCRWGRL